jgi:hypothetical protein
MAISVDCGTQIITVPKADTALVSIGPPEIRQLDLDSFRLVLKDLEDGVAGMPFLDTHTSNAPVTVGGVTLARVLEIINGYTVTFEDGQYAVNLVGANSNVADVANVNQVSIRSANSAGLTFSEQINNQSFNGFVWIDTTGGLPGILFPRGTPTDPVDNWPDAKSIADNLGIESFKLRHTLLVPASSPVDGYSFEGTNILDSVFVFQGGTSDALTLTNLTVAGAMGTGFVFVRQCLTGALTDFEGALVECVVNDTITLSSSPSSSNDTSFLNCTSGYPGDTSFTLNCNGTTGGVQFRNWSGGMTITNWSGGGNMSIDLSQGKVTLDATCTAGTILIRGVGEVVDNSGVGCTVLTTGLLKTVDIQTSTEDSALVRKVVAGRRVVVSPDDLTITVYEDDNIAVAAVYSVAADGRLREKTA